MKQFLAKHRNRIIHEIGSWLTSIISFIVADGAHIILAIYNGDFSSGTILTLRFLILKSVVKAILIKLTPQLFPLYRKNAGILPSSSQKEEV